MFPLFFVEKCASTNDEILHFVKQKDSSAAVYTFNQTSGRGQYGNRWETQKDQNLAYSFALNSRDFKLPDILFNFCTAVAVRGFLANLTQNTVEIKWPNDIIINGKKVAGMLTEKQKIKGREYFISGIGINILQKNFEGLPKAGSLFTQTRREFQLTDFTENLHEAISSFFQNLMSYKDVLPAFNENLFRKNEISVFEIEGVRQNGIIKNADENGFLWIELEKEGLKKFRNKEIELLY